MNDYSKYQIYARKVLSGEIPACQYIKQACRRYLSWFERDDIETIIDDQIVPIKYKIRGDFFECKENSSNCELSQEINNFLGVNFLFYWRKFK